MEKLKGLDLYRKLPTDMTKGTVPGSILSIVGVLFMALLFIMEFSSYMSTTLVTDITLDQHHNDLLQINFNLTLPRLSCAYASVDVSDMLGTHRVNVSKNIRKFRLDADGERLGEASAEIPVPHTEVVSESEKRAHEEMAGGSVALNSESVNRFIENHDLVLINFYAPWCHWSRALAPVWEKTAKMLAQDSIEQQYRIALGRVDCTHRDSINACRMHHIAAFPSVVIFRDGHTVSHEHYQGDRTSSLFMQFIQSAARELHPAYRAGRQAAKKPNSAAQGCLVSGFVEVRKVPGNFHVEASSKRHSFDHEALDLRHAVHQLTFGRPLNRRSQRRIPRKSRHLMDRLKGKVFESKLANATFEHYIKVVSTTFTRSGGSAVEFYKYTASSNSFIDEKEKPQARFSYDLSPMHVTVSEKSVALYHFLTSVCAIIGGVFTVLGLMDSAVYHGITAVGGSQELGR
jgi:thiol-disulfide isomerase/thioredoxin